MKKRQLVGVIAALLALPAVAGAEDTYLSLKGGVFLPNGKSGNGLNNFDAGYSVDLGLGVKLEQYVAVELGTGVYTAEGTTSSTDVPVDNKKLYAVPATLSVKGLLSLEKTDLYAGAGAGYYFAAMERKVSNGTATIDETSHGGAFGYHVVAGGDYRLSGKFTLGAEFKWFSTRPELEFTTFTGTKTKAKWELGGSTFGLSAKYWF